MASSKNVDFSKVKDGGNFNKKRIPAGDYLAKVVKIEDAESKSDQVFQYLVSIKLQKRPSSVFPYYCKLQENQLWKLRNLLIAAGLTVPKRKTKVDPNRVVGKLIGVTVEDDEFDGKEQSTIVGVFPAAELSEDDSSGEEEDENDEGADDDDEDEPLEDDEPEDEPEEDEAEEEDPYADMDRTALKAALVKLDASFKARKSQSDDDLRTLLRESASSDDDEPEDEDEEEEEAPAPKKRTATKKAPAKKAKKPINEVSDDELEELDIDDI